VTKTDPVLEAATHSLGLYLAIVHDTDMPQVAGGKAVPASHHEDMIDILEHDSYGHSLLLLPRGAAKTTILQAFVEWKLGRASLGMDGFGRNWAKDFRVGWVSASASQAYGVSNAIKETVEFNPIYRAMFPKVRPNRKKWSEPEWNVRGQTTKDYTFVAAGRGGPILGKRFHLIVPDDLAGEDERSSDLATATKPRRDLLFWIANTMMKTLVPGGRILMAATRWYEGDPPDWAMKPPPEGQGWHTLKIQALTDCEGCNDEVCPGEHSFWPERFPAALLIADRKKNPRSFALQMQNDITPAEGLWFRREWFPRFTSIPDAKDVVRVQTWDTAATLTGRSFTACLTMTCIDDGSGYWHYYLVDLYRRKVEFPDLVEAIYNYADKYHPNIIFVEDKSSGTQALQVLRRETQLPVVSCLPPGQRGGPDLDLWAAQATIACKTERVFLPADLYFTANSKDNWVEASFMPEILRYEGTDTGGTTDVVMAMCQAIYRMEQDKEAWEELKHPRPQLTYGQSTERALPV